MKGFGEFWRNTCRMGDLTNPHRLAVKIMMGITLTFMIAYLFALVFQCSPINYAWLRWDNEHEGRCINVYVGIYAHAAINMVLDLIILLMPMPILLKLQTNYSWKQKSHVIVMFSFGVIVTAVCILRLNTLIVFGKTQNPTWDYLPAALWSIVEMQVGVICACLPAAKVFFARLLPGWLGVSTGKSKTGASSQTAPSTKPPSKVPDRVSVTVNSFQTRESGFMELVDMDPHEGWRSNAGSRAQKFRMDDDHRATHTKSALSYRSDSTSARQWS
jgi:hypothetical protein